MAEVILISVAAATIIDVWQFWPPGLPTLGELEAQLRAQWCPIVIGWLDAYGVLVVALITHQTISSRAQESPRRGGRYLKLLALSQYWTALVTLVGLGVWQLRDAGRVNFSLPAIADASGFRAAAVVAFAGVAGLLVAFAAAALPTTHRSQTAAESTELTLLREILRLLQGRPQPEATENPQLSTIIEQGHRTTLEAVKELATVVNRLGHHSFADLRAGPPEAGRGQPTEANPALPAEMDDAAASLQAAMVELSRSIARLHEVATALHESTFAPKAQALAAISLAQLSGELDALLRTIDEHPDN